MATVVLVHGAWANPSDWDEVRALLDERGIESVAVDSPSARRPDADLAADVAEVRRVLDELDGDKVLVGWSYGGMVISDAGAGRGDVAHLVYVAAMMPEVGQTAWDITSAAPSVLGEEGFLSLHDEGTTSITAWPDPRAEELYGSAMAAIMARRPRRRQAIASSFAPATAAAWQDVPTTYVVTTRDRALDPGLQRTFASKVGSIVELDASHFPMWEAAEALVDAIATACRATPS